MRERGTEAGDPVRGLIELEMERQGWEALEGRQLNLCRALAGVGGGTALVFLTPAPLPTATSSIAPSGHLKLLQGVRLGTSCPRPRSDC